MKLTNHKIGELDGSNIKVVVILPFFNETLGYELYQNLVDELQEHKVQENNIKLVRVPGALEIPIAAKQIATSKNYDVIIALGIIIRGDTAHFEHVCRESSNGCMQVQLESMTPIINGILTVENKQQAEERISKQKLNKAKEFAESAIYMAQLINS